jgi:hypothetical protein
VVDWTRSEVLSALAFVVSFLSLIFTVWSHWLRDRKARRASYPVIDAQITPHRNRIYKLRLTVRNLRRHEIAVREVALRTPRALRALENAAGVDTSLTKRIGNVGAITHQSASRHELTPNVRRRYTVAGCQCNELSAPIIEKRIGGNQECVDVLLVNGRESGFELAFGAGIQHTHLAPERTHCGLQFCQPLTYWRWRLFYEVWCA